MSRTKIIATIGPRSASAEMLRALHDAGMGVARLNGSHANLDWHGRAVALIRETLPDAPILFDIPGRKIRTLQLAEEPSFATGDVVTLTTDADAAGARVPVNYPRLHEDLAPDDVIFADDGTLRFTVLSVDGRDIVCRADVAGTLRSRKGINVPAVSLKTPLVTESDHAMIGFTRDNQIDFVGLSFVESAAHVEAVRELIGDTWPRIVAKVENQRGLDRVEEVVAAADAIMIDRGDLSVETNLESVAIFQKRIIKVAQAAGKPVIVATEMLHTMIDSPYPTKAEVSDIANAVLDGCTATMLSGETAIGGHPVEAVTAMRRVADSAASHVQDTLNDGRGGEQLAVAQAMEDAIALICRNLAVTKIVAVTISGYAARMIAARRPSQPILAVSNDAMAARSFNLMAGVDGIHIDIPFARDSTDHVVRCLEELWHRGLLAREDLVLVTSVGYPRSGNRMNLIQTHHVADLAETLAWAPPREATTPDLSLVGRD